MIRKICHIIHGYLIWQKYRLEFHLNQQKVVLVLAGENDKIDNCALIYLGDYVRRKIASQAIILTSDERTWRQALKIKFQFPVKIYRVCDQELLLLYDYYCFEEHLDNVVFTYTYRPKDNLLGRLLNETDVNEEEAVCLGCYCLRRIPEQAIL